MMNVLEEVMRIITAAESKDDKPTTWQIRVQLAGSILDLILIDTEVCVLATGHPGRGSLTYPHLMLINNKCVCFQLPILGSAHTQNSLTLGCMHATACFKFPGVLNHCHLPHTHCMPSTKCLCIPLTSPLFPNTPLSHRTAADTFIPLSLLCQQLPINP